MLRTVDNFLNSITMYRLVLYGLSILAAIAVVINIIGILPFSTLYMIASLIFLIAICMGVNFFFAKLLHAPTNVESSIISALILFFILNPAENLNDFKVLLLAGTLAMASKYILSYNMKHIFNPVAISAVILDALGFGVVSWWVGSAVLTPFVLVLGLLIVRKIRKFEFFLTFTITALISIGIFGVFSHMLFLDVLRDAIISWPLFFFASVMLTEPLTTPPTKTLYMLYAVLVGILFGAQYRIGPLFSTPELALCLGNIYSFLVSPRFKLRLTLKDKKSLTPFIQHFSFRPNRDFQFSPGQYLEWTLPHNNVDSRGNRRYFTIASSPTEKELQLGVRMAKDGSSFKHALDEMKLSSEMFAGQLGGDFTLPTDSHKKLVFIAGGIGITPFRSMAKYLIDKNEIRDIVLFYACANPVEFVYQDIFKDAERVGLKTVYLVTNKESLTKDWNGESGYLTKELLKKKVSDYKERTYYLSGPNAMVHAYKSLLHEVGIQDSCIVTDYFPGF